MVEQYERDYLSQYAVGIGIDIGCGKHKIGKFGIDLDPNSNANLFCDMLDIPIAGNTQDYLIACHVLEHTPHTIKALKEWHRLLKNGGILALAVPDGEKTNPEDLGDRNHKQLFSLQTLCNFLQFVGFKIINTTWFKKEETKVGPSLVVIAQK
jgi:ubiquinone/menaquinone biosynthesis C-methylase UbiE